MKLGLLICDHARKELNHPDGSYPGMFRRLLPDFDFSDYYVCDGNFPGSPYECDGWIISGSRLSVYDDVDWINRLKGFTRGIAVSGKPCIGVCFGHQMIGAALARSPMCPNAMILIGKNMLGIQGHPEFSVDFEHKLILANAKYLEPGQVSVGINSLKQVVHSQEVGGWMGRFLLRRK